MNTPPNTRIAPQSNDSARRTRIRTAVVSAGTIINEQPSQAGTYTAEGQPFSLDEGAAHLQVRVTMDDSGSLEIRNENGIPVFSISGALGDWTRSKDPTYWQESSGTFSLPAGSYTVHGSGVLCGSKVIDP